MNEHSPIEPFERVATPEEENLSSQLSNLVQLFASAAHDLNGALSSGIIGRLTDFLRGKKLRYFAYEEEGSGSLANTVNLIRRMISLGFQLDVELIYNSTQKTLLQGLAELLPGFDPAKPAPYKLNGVTITFFAYEETTVGGTTHRSVQGLSGQMPLCLCGGGDILSSDNTSMATAVKCDYFVLLQPYLWTAEKCTPTEKTCPANSLVILPGLNKTINLDDQLVLQGDQFAYRSFKQDLPEKFNWADLKKIPNVNTKAISAVQNLIKALGKTAKPGIEFFPVANLPSSSTDKTSLTGSAEGIAFELIAAAALLQKQKGFTKKPVVIAVLGDLSSSTWQTLERYFPAKNEAQQGAQSSLDALTKNVQAYCKSQQVFRNTTSSGTGIYLSKDLSGAAGAAFLSNLKPGATVVTTISGLPPAAADYLYDAATLPGVLEGIESANLAVNLGKPFFKLGNFTTNPYPSTFANGKDKAAGSTTPTTAALFNVSKNQIALGISAFQEGYKSSMPPNELAQIMAEITTQFREGKGEYFEYYSGLKQYYTASQNDKLLQALGFLAARFALVSVASGVAGSIFSDLKTLLTTLQNHVSNGALPFLPNVLKEGPLHTFLQTALGAGGLTIGSAKDPVTIKPVYTAKRLSKVIVTGKTSNFLGTELDVTLSVSGVGRATKKAGKNYQVRFEVDLKKLSLPGVEWFALENTSLFAQFSSAGARLTGGLQTSVEVGDTLLPFQMNFPSSASNKMVVEGDFSTEATPSLNSVFAFIGGINFANTIPSEFAGLNELSVDGLRFNYNSATKTIESFQVSLRDSKQWNLFGGLAVKDLSFEITASEPTGNRQISWVASTQAVIGEADNPPHLDISVTYPQTTLTAALSPDGPSLPLSDLVKALLPKGYHLNVGADIANLQLEYSPAKSRSAQTYSVEAGVDLQNWQITLPPAEFELNDIYFDVKGEGTNSFGSIRASTTLFDGLSGVEPVHISVSATYNTKDKLWTFHGEQGAASIKVSQIIKAYIGSDWATGGLDVDVSDLNVTFSTGNGKSAASYEFGGSVSLKDKAPSWLPAQATFTAKIGNTGGSELLLPGGNAHIPVLDHRDEIVLIEPAKSLVRYETTKNDGKYALLTADIRWNNIELQAFYEYAKSHSHFGIMWGPFSAEVDENQTATIKFTDTTTLGAMVETFVEWMTGARFGLAAPFDVLNHVNLSDFELIWNFKEDTVSFTVEIGPIDLLIAKVTGITLTYKKSAGVYVKLDGSFFWLSGASEAKGLPPWRADQPSSTPSPGGAGNKYLDLRLLAGGQHVDVKGLQDVTEVQQAVDILAKLPKPTVGKVPDIGFDGDINWLFATDFGVLRIDASKELGQEHQGELEKGGAQYAFTLQVVLTDPTLYALRIACQGKAAKIFSGLDFQVIYKKVSPGLGKFSASIQLPEIMRRIDVGAVSITLPTFGIEVYTNGDFQFDIGFPWNNNFSHSFSIEAIVPPGIPLKGGGGFYFGKLPAASVRGLPTSTLGFFNPNLVFGVGLQLGLGKSIQKGILKAGFSLTAFGILQGILAKWNAYDDTHTDSSNALALQGEYFFSLTGTVGTIGKLYGSIDFAIIKAAFKVRIEVSAQIKLASYEPIPLTISAKVDVSASAKIDLGLFTIKVSFSFSAHVHTTFTLGALQNPNDAPWLEHSEAEEGLLAVPVAQRLALYSRLPILMEAHESASITFNWTNLSPAADPSQNPLEIHLGYGLTLAKQEDWPTSNEGRPPQVPCYVANLFIGAPPPATPGDNELFEKAASEQDDTAFEALAKMVTRWAIAATMGSGRQSAVQVDSLVISAVDINALLDGLNMLESAPDAMTQDDISTFLQQQFQLDIAVPARQGEAQATYFPMVPVLSLALEQDSKSVLSYTFEAYNKISDNYRENLTKYFNQLSVMVENEGKKNPSEVEMLNSENSVASYIYENYFMLIMKQMIENLLNGLRDFNYALSDGDTPSDIVSWVNEKGDLSATKFTLTDLFKSNDTHPLTAGVALTIPTAPLVIPADSSFNGLASDNLYKVAVDPTDLVSNNSRVSGLLRTGAMISYTQADGTVTRYIISGEETVSAVASALGVTLDELISNSTLPTQTDLLVVGATLQLPEFTYQTKATDTLTSIAQQFEINLSALATTENGEIANLFASSSGSKTGTNTGSLSIVHLPQFQVGELIKEVQRTGGITHLSGMASRYYFHGMRLPTDGITPLEQGMWTQRDEAGQLTLPKQAGLFALSGQQIPIPTPLTSSITLQLGKPKDADWIILGNDQNPLKYSVEVPAKEATPSKDYQRIQSITNYGTAGYLPAGPDELSLLAQVEQQPSAFPIPHFVKWQSAEPINVPTSDADKPSQLPYLLLWTLSGALTALGASTAENADMMSPQMVVEQVSMDAATGTLTKTPLVNFGWTSTIEFSIKKLPPQKSVASASSDATLKTTYELNGVNAAGVVILERLLQALPEDHSFPSLTLGYTTGSQSSGTFFVGEGGRNVTFGISQTNLSTVTNPGAELFLEQSQSAQGDGPTLLNTPMALIKRLWEAGITNSGGFYLYYTADDGATGFPSGIFNEKGEATLSLVIIHEDQTYMHPYINGLATAQPLASSGASLSAAAKGELVEHTSGQSDTLEGIATRYHSNLNSLITQTLTPDAVDIMLTPGKTITIEQGTYMVPLGTSAPGASFASIALRFGTSTEALKQMNPRLTGKTVPASTPLRLPVIDLVIGSKTLSNDLKTRSGIKQIADYFGTEPIVLAVANANTEGLLVPGQTLTVRAGPLSVQPGEHPGVQSLNAQRAQPPQIPSSGTDQTYAEDLLLHNYSLLAYAITENQDFNASNMGLPIGVSGQSTSPDESKIRYVLEAATGDMQDYQGAISYLGLMKPEKTAQTTKINPYSANGLLLQTQLGWNDYYGNTILSTLDERTDPAGKLNNKPALQGYTDQIIPLSQWPSTSANWTVAAGQTNASEGETAPESFTLEITFSFDSGPFIPQKGQDPTTGQQRAAAALLVVEEMLAQFNDPNGFEIDVNSTLSLETYQLSQTEFQSLISWWQEIEVFLRKQSNAAEAGAAQTIPALPVHVTVPMTSLTQEPLFELVTQLIFKRPHGIAVGDYAADPLTRSVANTVTIQTSVTGPSKQSGTDKPTKPTSDLLAGFAQRVAQAIYGDDFRMMVASGVNRYAPSAGMSSNATWGIRVGVSQGDPISFNITDENVPEIFAPLPVSNTLISRRASVYPYETLDDFDPQTGKFTSTPVPSTFSNVEMDVWLKQYFQFFDALLSPKYSSSILFVDKLAAAKPDHIACGVGASAPVSGYMEALAEQKKSLARITTRMLAPIYQDGSHTCLSSAQETFRQTLLEELSNLYTTQAVISFAAQVAADIPLKAGEETPQLFGNINLNSVADCPPDTGEKDQPPTSAKSLASLFSLTSPKLLLQQGEEQPLTFLLQASEKLGETSECLKLDLSYKVSALEHQISPVEGIKDYKASSWLSPIEAEGTPVLEKPLGSFNVPILLRSFPETPRMVEQAGPAFDKKAHKLSKVTKWDYEYTYGLNFHYLQDEAHGEIQFNLKDKPSAEFAGFLDAFAELAQFISVQENLSKILDQYVPVINAANQTPEAIENASKVLAAIIKINEDIICKAQSSGSLAMLAAAPQKDAGETYQFSILEGNQIYSTSGETTQSRWVVKLILEDCVPLAGLTGDPSIEIPEWTSHLASSACEHSKQTYTYYYTQKAKGKLSYLLQDTAQSLSDREVILPGMQVLARQDAIASMYLIRNSYIHGKITEGFVFRTPTATFKNPFHPTLSSTAKLNIAFLDNPTKKPYQRSLEDHLGHLFTALFDGEYAGDITLQLNIGYTYHLSEGLTQEPIDLPIALLPPTPITIQEDGKPAGDVLKNLANSIIAWAQEHKPSCIEAELHFAMNIMSNLTENPMPLLNLQNLYLCTADIVPPLPSYEGETELQ